MNSCLLKYESLKNLEISYVDNGNNLINSKFKSKAKQSKQVCTPEIPKNVLVNRK